MDTTLKSNRLAMETHTVASLHEAYSIASNCELTEEQFITLLTFYPALLVVSADGEIDEEEGIYVKHIAKFMANSYGESQNFQVSPLEKQFYLSLLFLHEEEEKWKTHFLKVLHDYLAQIPLLKENIAEVMLMFADSSGEISEEENKIIREVAHHLDIELSLFDLAA